MTELAATAAPAAALSTVVDTTGDVAGPDLSDAALEAAAIAEFAGAGNVGVLPTAAPPAVPAPTPNPSPDGPGAPAGDAVPADPASIEAARIQALVDKQLEGHRARESQSREMAAMKAELDALKAAVADRDGKLAKLREEPLEVLQGEGWDAEALAGAMAGMKNPTTVQMRQLQGALKQMQAKLDAAEAERTRAAEAGQAQTRVNTYIATEVRPQVDRLLPELTHLQAEMEAWGGKSDADAVAQVVYARLNAEYQGGGQVPTAEAMARNLEAQAKKRIEAIRGKLSPTAAVATANLPKPQPKTLTNQLTQTTRATPEPLDLSDAALTAAAIEFARQAAG